MVIIGVGGNKFNMTAISHALIGAAIAAKTGDPLAAGVIAFFTHFACDLIPHWDLGTNWRLRPRVITGVLAIGETLFALVGVYLIFFRLVPSAYVLAVAITFSLAPDWLEVPYYLTLPHSPKLFQQIYKLESYAHAKLDWPWGAVTQVAVVAAFLIWGFLL